MTRYKQYTAYKNSGVEWLGDVPEHWDICAVRLMFSIGRGRVINNEEICENPGMYPVYSSQTVNNGVLGYISSFDFNGDYITWTTDGANAGTIFLRNGKFNCTNVCGTLKPFDDRKVNLRFYAYILSIATLRYVRYDINPKLMNEVMASIRLPLISTEEQNAIATFLDREITSIDALVEKKEAQIRLLEEKRQAMISHAVTKGISPDVTMKVSGIEWLGEVPKHWEVGRLKFYANLQSGIAKGKDTTGKETISVPMLRVANVQDGYVDLTEVHEIEIEPHQLERYKLKFGDVLMNEGGDYDKLGRGAVWHAEIDPCIHQNHVFAVRPAGIEPEWLDMLTQASYAKFYFARSSKQSTNLASISSTNILETPILIPPKDERRAIMDFCHKELNRIDGLIERVNKSITLLRERRSALITTAVTGQIDVRDMS